MRKITVIGNAGAGKSTFAESLAAILGIELLHIDRIQWRPGWELLSEEEFLRLHDPWLERESWIIEGVGVWSAILKRFAAADTIIFLDYPPEICKERARRRTEEDRLSPNKFLPPDCPYSEKQEEIEAIIDRIHSEMRPQLLALLHGYRETKNSLILRNDREKEDFLAGLRRIRR